MTTAEQDIKIARTKQEVDDFKSTIENFILEMRDRDNQRAEENRRLQDEMKEARAKHDAEMKIMNDRIDSSIRDIRTFTIASVVGIGAIVVSVIVFVSNSIFNPPTPQIIYQQVPAQQIFIPQQNSEQGK